MRPGYKPIQPQIITSVKPLIPFDVIVDTDFGLLRLIKDKYCNKQMFYTQVFLNKNIDLLWLLYNRTNVNPLQVIARDEDHFEIYDNYYKEFMSTQYTNILARSIFTEIYKLLKITLKTEKAVVPTIVCKTNEEKEYLLNEDKELFSQLPIILAPNMKLAVTIHPDINAIFTRYFPSEPLSYKDITDGISLYVAGYRYNFKEVAPNIWGFDKEEYNSLADKFVIKCYMPYPFDLDRYPDVGDGYDDIDLSTISKEDSEVQ